MASINTIVKRKQYLWLGIVVVGTASAIGGALYLSDVDMSGNGETVAEQEPVPDMTGVVDTTFDDKVRQHATTEMQVTAAQMQKQYEEIRRELDVLNKQRGDDQRRIEKLGQDNAALAEQVKALGANPVTATGEPVPQMPASPPGPEGEPQPGNTPVSFPPQGSVAVPPPTAFYPGNGVTPPPQVTYQSVPVPNRIQRKVFTRNEGKQGPSLPYIPSGSFAKAMLIEGADANASVTGNESTVPMQLRITGLVEMPNSKTYDATGCFVGLEAWGDVSSERAIVRTRNISCLKDGKTIDMPIIRRLANYARQRGDMVVIYDRSGEFVKSYYDPSIDKILNPLDARCAAWDLWKECLTQPDFDNTANTLIPMGTKEDPFWQGSGRTIFAEAAYLMRNDPNRSYSKLVDTLLSIKIEKLRTFLRNSPAANLVEEKIEKTAISIRAVLTNYVKAIRYLQGIEHNGEPFTIRDWMRGVREDQKNGWLFISSNADTHASLKPVISMWLSIAIRGLLAMGENRNRRVWFFCDELPTLHKLPDLVEILPEARKFGGCYVFGIQSYAQLEDIYGEKAAATLFDVMNTRAFFRSPSHKIAEFAAGEIGEKEHLKASEQYSYGADPVRDGVSTGKDMERQTLVSYSDIQSLPDLTCYVTLPGPYPAVKLSLKYQTRPKVAPEFIPRDINPEMENRLSAVLAAREAEGRQMASLFEPDVPEVVSGEDVTQA
ncbi:TPA: type IV conjugative transfer system coupling protein TraD, partial [Escherichia coli]|nr:type IV conjugative transfer system coupling protein TraD [Escherichia coli]HBH5285159.1 type IV conjugative transfer system coupling protein TraD [Escherichia coli]HBH5304551.1 type IV conjugative transfer system coupling protein TraD [Escherichia coli]